MAGKEIYFFSGTGNSFAVARDIAGRLNAELISIPGILQSESERVTLSPETEIVGIAFPDYHSSVPNIIKRFIERIDSFEGKYIFGVCTYGGKGPGRTVRDLQQVFESKGGRLAGGFAVRMPYNYIIPSFSFKQFSSRITLKDVPVEEQHRLFSEWKTRLEEIVNYIKHRKNGVYETSAETLLKFIDLIKLKESLGKYTWLRMAGYYKRTALSFAENRQLMDHGFYANENCIACGTCEKLCPVKNIKLVNHKPSWQHRCEQCFACLQWCPKSAIQFGEHTRNNKRYHHPDVKASELMVRI